jgi:hypothetical protein
MQEQTNLENVAGVTQGLPNSGSALSLSRVYSHFITEASEIFI